MNVNVTTAIPSSLKHSKPPLPPVPIFSQDEAGQKPTAKIPCKFGRDCYLKNEYHLDNYSHPSAGDVDVDDDDKDDAMIEDDPVYQDDTEEEEEPVIVRKINLPEKTDAVELPRKEKETEKKTEKRELDVEFKKITQKQWDELTQKVDSQEVRLRLMEKLIMLDSTSTESKRRKLA
eukprot:TRINITY_DN2571_c0_g1_i3.p1 TRINITY_DN2571_c0_g1~~TRINITY_DN2571_c0_g1_i3.p1  ORF type:complete len:176 (-),score=65.06 TRINITY_DN2571_c0_g1_i3:86-613(-)